MYQGPIPTDIDIKYPVHTYELITCLINGEQKKIIQDRYLKKFNSSKEEYLRLFPGAPLKSLSASESYSRAANSDEGKKRRSETITNLNLNNRDFQEKRIKASREFLDSDRSMEYRKKQSDKAKKQHKETDLEEHVREYFKTRYQGSKDQTDRSIRMIKNNIGSSIESKQKSRQTYIKNSELGLHNKETKFKKKKYKETNLIYQSSYELDFLIKCEELNILNRIKNSPCLSDKDYPYNFYQPDYILDDAFIIEIKSWYIENLQEKQCPGILKMKEELVVNKGYKFLYLRDKNYNPLLTYLRLN
jgi:hypothetical protein